MRKDIAPEVEHKPDSPISDTVEHHPAFGQIGAARVTGRTFLYGSDFEHHNFIRIRVNTSELARGLSNDRPHAGNRLVELDLSEAQWASFVSTLNQGDGIQCTLNWTEGMGQVPGITRPKSRQAQFEGEMMDCLREAEKQAKVLQKLIDEGGGKVKMRDAIIRLINHLTPNINFVAKQFGEHMEDTTEKAKIEINAYIEGTLRRAEVAALSGEGPLSISSDKIPRRAPYQEANFNASKLDKN